MHWKIVVNWPPSYWKHWIAPNSSMMVRKLSLLFKEKIGIKEQFNHVFWVELCTSCKNSNQV